VPSSSSPQFPWWLRWFLVPTLGLGSAGCKDNVACVFAGTCSGGAGPISDNPAQLPLDGEMIVDGPPAVQSFFPAGLENADTTPVVVVFSESMQAMSLGGAIEIVILLGGGLEGGAVGGVAQTLVSDGRVLLLLPTMPLDPGDYIVRLTENAQPLDLTGQALDDGPGTQIGSFSVSASPASVPQLVMTFPARDARDQSETAEILAVFDRPVEASSVDTSSFDVRVDGADPAFDPPPESVRIGGGSVEDTRAFLYRSVDADGVPVSLGTNAMVELRLSPAGNPIMEMDGGSLAAQTITFRTTPIATVRAACLMSIPHDAIGLANLERGNTNELLVHVDLDADPAGLETNDNVDLFLFGDGRGPTQDFLIALQRTKRLTDVAPVLFTDFTRDDVAMHFSDTPGDVRFRDGPVTFAFRARRGTVVTPLRILDLDPDPEIIQDPLLDTVVPTIERIGASGGSEFRSDLRRLALHGKASESIASTDVETPEGGMPERADVIGSNDAGLFLARPLGPEIVAGGQTTFAVTALDQALNPSQRQAGTFVQVGVVGPGVHVPGNPLEVEIHDAATLGDVTGAVVLVHSDLGPGVVPPVDRFPFERSIPAPGGTVMVDTNAMTGGLAVEATIVTVVAPGHDLFTLHGVPSAHVSIPLRPTGRAPARASGAVVTTNPGSIAFLDGLARRVDDSRRSMDLPRGFAADASCSGQAPLRCPYGPADFDGDRLGVRSMFAGNLQLDDGTFQAGQLLRAFAFVVPLDTVLPGASQSADMELTSLLDDPATPDTEVAQALEAFTFFVEPGSGIDLTMLEDDAATSGLPFVSVDVIVPGLSHTIAVAPGLAFQQVGSTDRWTVRAAQPGAISPAGSLGSKGVVDSDPYVRVEVIEMLDLGACGVPGALGDLEGNAVGVRPRRSTIQAAGPMPEFRALAVPAQLTPACGGAMGGQAATLLLTHVVGDERAMAGLYRVELRDASGRGWTLWRPDPPGTDPIEVRIVDVAGDAGVVGLADGAITSRVAAFAWPGLVPESFLWSDLEQRFELFSRARPISFQKP